MHYSAKTSVLSIAFCIALAACGGGDGGGADTSRSFSTDPNPVVIDPPVGVKVTATSLPERTGDYRGEANRTWSVLEQAGVKAVGFVAETRMFVPAKQRYMDHDYPRTDMWADEFVAALNTQREQYVDKTYIVRQNRRFLYYKPKREAESGKYPLMIVLHGHNVSPEFERHANTLGRMDELAERDGFVVVYANGQQPKGETKSDAFYANLGIWGSCGMPDVDYFNRIVPELEARGIPIDQDRIYMAGTSAGGAAAFDAAVAMGGKFAGIAAVTPNYSAPAGAKEVYEYQGKIYEQELNPCGVRTQRPLSVMVIHSLKDPAFWNADGEVNANNRWAEKVRKAWRQALGVSETITETLAIPNAVQEGSTFVGASTRQMLTTRNSQAKIYRYAPALSGATFEYIEMDHAGHGWPTPRAIDDWHGNVEAYGLRNQDFDASDVIWEFMKTKRRIP